MTRRYAGSLFALVGLISCRAMGDIAPLPPDTGISDHAKSDLSASTHEDEINQKVHDEVAKLIANPSDLATVSMIRNWLINEMELDGSPGSTTPAYKEAYSNALNHEFVTELSDPGAPIALRLNAGIVIHDLPGHAAENLAPTVLLLLADKSAPVAMWGAKAAGAILPLMLMDKNPNTGVRDQLLAAIIKTVGDHPKGLDGGMVALEAYKAINPKTWTTKPTLSPDAMSALVGANLSLQAARIEVYKGTGVPENPKADTYPSYFLMTDQTVWSGLTDAQKLSAMQQAMDLTNLAGQRAGSGSANQNEEVIEALQEEGKWFAVLATFMDPPDSDLKDAGEKIYKLSVATPPDAVRTACAALFPILQKSFPTLQDPASLSAPKSASDASGSNPTSEARP